MSDEPELDISLPSSGREVGKVRIIPSTDDLMAGWQALFTSPRPTPHLDAVKAQLRETQTALAASQADLTRAEAKLRAAYRDIEDLTVRLGLETEARAGAVIALHAAEKQLAERNPEPRRPYGTEDLDPRREPHR